MGETIFIALIILIVLGALQISLYLHKRAIKRWAGYLQEAKVVINGEWLKFGEILEGEYRGRKVQCGFYESKGLMPFLKMKPNKPFNVEGIKPKKEWIDRPAVRSPSFRKNLRGKGNFKRDLSDMVTHPGEFLGIRFFKKDYFTGELEEIYQFCAKVETGEIKLTDVYIFNGYGLSAGCNVSIISRNASK